MSDEVQRAEFEARLGDVKEDVTALGNVMRDDFKSVWRAIDGMLIKVGVVVTICSTVVLGLFKIAEHVK